MYTTRFRWPQRGFDGSKKVNGRKRHVVVDTQGLVLALKVHTANITDRDAAQLVLTGMPEHFPRIRKLWTDSGEGGRFRSWAAEHLLDWDVEIVKHWWTGIKGVWVGPGMESPTIPSGFHILPRRRVAERNFGSLARFRRLARDYERLPQTLAGLHFLAFAMLMLKRFINFMLESA